MGESYPQSRSELNNEHNIRVKDECGPIAFQPRRLSRTAEEEVKKELRELEKMGVISTSLMY